MKRVKLLLIGIFAVILVTGCAGTKELNCTKTSNEEGLKSTESVVMKFKKDKPIYAKMAMDFEANSDEMKDYWETYTEMMDEAFAEFEEKDGLTLDSKNDPDKYKYTMSIEIDLEKLSQEDLEELNLDDAVTDTSATYEQSKKDAEADGYTCK